MRSILIVISFLIIGVINAQTIQWRGINGSGHYPDKTLLKVWPEQGPELILEVEDIGTGWGGVVFETGNYYVIGKKDTIDYLSCVNSQGEIAWQHVVGNSWMNSFPDSRSTPIVDKENIYAMSGSGNLSCFSKTSGELIWQVNVDHEFKGEWHRWGNSESPLIYKDLVISIPGGESTTMVALNKNTGETVWKTESLGNERTYITPVVFENNKLVQIIGMTSGHLFGVNPTNGSIDWKFQISDRYKELYDPNGRMRANYTNSPIYHENKILIPQGYDLGTIQFELNDQGDSITETWFNKTLDPHHHGAVLIDGYVYGSNWINNRTGNWVCLNWETGKVMWDVEYNTKGAIITADHMIYTHDETGVVSLIEPSKDELKVVSSFKIEKGDGQHWAHPTIFKGQLIIRHGNYFAAYNIKQD